MPGKPLTAREIARLRNTRWTAAVARSVLDAHVAPDESLSSFARRQRREEERQRTGQARRPELELPLLCAAT